MQRSTIIRMILSLALMAYLVIMLSWVVKQRDESMCRGVDIEINDPTGSSFVTREAIAEELGSLIHGVTGRSISSINTDSIERVLSRVDKIEEASAVRMPNGRILITVTPIKPVMRVFQPDGTSYYVNKDGKLMKASLRYRIDVPVVVNEGDTSFRPADIIPLLDRLRADSLYHNMVTAINITRGGDIILVPSIRGMYINLGDTSILENKLARLRTIYNEVLPIKGWLYYDTISVKWNRQVVATRRQKDTQQTTQLEEFHDEEGDDIGTITTSTEPSGTKP